MVAIYRRASHMNNHVYILMVIIGLVMLNGAAGAADLCWNIYSCAEYGLVFSYPDFLNIIEVVCSGWDNVKLSDGSVPEYTKLWTSRNYRHLVNFSVSDDSTRRNCMSVAVHDITDGFDLWRCATELATFRIDEPFGEGHWVDYDTLAIGDATVLHVRSYNYNDGNKLKWANIYVMQSRRGYIFSLGINESRMKSALIEEYGDYDAVINRIISSIPWIK